LLNQITQKTSKTEWEVAIPIAIGYIPIAITYGLLAKASGIPDYISIMISILVFAGASQFIAVNLITLLIKNSMGIALYAMFIGLLIPSCKKSWFIMAVTFIAIFIHSALFYIPLFDAFSSGTKIIVSIVISAAIGVMVFSNEIKNIKQGEQV